LALNRLATVACFGALALAVTACSSFSQATRPDAAQVAGSARTIDAALPVAGPSPAIDAALPVTGPSPAIEAALPVAGPPRTIEAAFPADAEPAGSTATSSEGDRAQSTPETPALEEGMAQARDDLGTEEPEEYDPWERWNEPMFNFNRRLDKYVLKPVAKGYNFVVPDEIQIMISNGFDNISFVPRLVNSLLQGKVKGAGRELGRFLINSTAGVGGLFDPAKDVFGILKSREDFGQTLGVWGVGSGPYLIVPFMEPLTVRDGVGKAVDSAMDPLSYFLPLIWERLAMKVGDIVNERSLNLDLFQGFEESVIDMYSAVRHAYLQRRLRLIRE
jgi:phospholipid-binding lipoprotein MlaA